MKNILVFIDNFDTGGVTNVVMSIYERLDKTRFHMDFACRKEAKNILTQKIEQNGSVIYYYDVKPLNVVPVINYIKQEYDSVQQLLKQLKNVNYDIIHIHARPNIGLLFAKKLAIPMRIMHVHEAVTDFNGNEKKSKITNIIWKRRQKEYDRLATVKVGDSMKACQVKFGDVRDCIIVHPAINMERFDRTRYDKNKAIQKYQIDRESLNLIHVGRLNIVKNQRFILDIVAEINKEISANLYIVGDGELKEQLKKQAEQLGISKCVKFLPGDTEPDIYCGMDYSLLPSFSEAFGMVAVEAQIMGVTVFASTNVPEDVNIGKCVFWKLELGAAEWAERIIKYKENRKLLDKESYKQFKIETIIKQIEGIYDDET